MAGSFAAGSPEMQTAAQQLQEANSQLQGNLKKLQGEVEGIASTWQGEAASAFQTLMQKFDEDGQKLNQNLMQIAEALDANAKNYAQQEQDQHSQIQGILGSLS